MNRVMVKFCVVTCLAALLALVAFPAQVHAQLNTVVQNGTSQTGLGSGFGGVVGGGTLSFTQTAGSPTINLAFTRGAGNLNDAAVIYIAASGTSFSDTSSFTDTGGGMDALRKAISGFDGTNRSTVNFGSGFAPTHAIAFNTGFAGIWGLNSSSHVYGGNTPGSGDLGLSPSGSASASVFNLTLSLDQLGLVPGNSFDYVVTYLNSGNAFRSNEFIGTSTVPASNVGQAPVTLAAGDFNRYTSAAIPEPGTFALLGLGVFGVFAKRRKK